MRSRLIVAAAFGTLLVSRSLVAQSTDTILDQMRTPASPAFVLLGIAPSAVERPTTPKAVAATVISASNGFQSLPKNYALEVAPYWLTQHRTLTWDRFQHPGVWQSILQNLSVSLATASGAPAVSDSSTAVGLGVRTFVSFTPADTGRLIGLLDAVQQAQNVALLHHESQQVLDSLTAVNAGLTQQIQALVKERTGFIVEAAAGLVALYPNNSFDKGSVSRVGVWITPTYRLAHPQMDFLMVGRLIRDVSANHSTYDFGGRLVYSNRGLSFSGEYVGRTGNLSTDKTHRAAGNLEYRWAEGKYLTATFGKDFDAPGGHTLLAQIGVDFGFGQVPILHLK